MGFLSLPEQRLQTFFHTAMEFVLIPAATSYEPTTELILTMLNQLQQSDIMFMNGQYGNVQIWSKRPLNLLDEFKSPLIKHLLACPIDYVILQLLNPDFQHSKFVECCFTIDKLLDEKRNVNFEFLQSLVCSVFQEPLNSSPIDHQYI